MEAISGVKFYAKVIAEMGAASEQQMSSYYWRHMDRELEFSSPRAPGICRDPLGPLCAAAAGSSVVLQELALKFQAFIYGNKIQNFRHFCEKLRNI